MDFFRCKCCQTPPGEKKKKTKLNCAKQIRIFWKRAEVHNYIHEQCEMSLAQLNHGWCSVSYFLHLKNIQCLPFDHRQSCPSSMNLTFLKHPRRPSLYISNTWSYCSRSDRNFPEAHGLSTNKQATRRKKKNREKKTKQRKTKREGRKLISCPSGGWHPLYPLCHFFLIC